MASNRVLEIIIQAKDRTSKALGTIGGGLSKIWGIATDLKTVLASIAAGMGFAKLVENFINTASSFENLEASLTTVTGSLDGARAAMAYANKEAAASPFTVLEYAEAIKTLASYGIDYEASMRTLGDTAAAMGKPLSQAVEAFADALRGEGERLKEFGITQQTEGNKLIYTWQNALGETQKTIAEKNPEIIAEVLRGIWNEKYEGGMKAYASTWSGLTSTLKSNWDEFLVAIGNAGLLDALKTAVSGLLDKIQEWKDGGQFASLAKQISDAATSLVTWTISLAKSGDTLDAYFDLASGVVGGFVNTVRLYLDTMVTIWFGAWGKMAGALDTLTFGKIPGLDGIAQTLQDFSNGAALSMSESAKGVKDNAAKIGDAWTRLERSSGSLVDEVAKQKEAFKTAGEEAEKAPAKMKAVEQGQDKAKQAVALTNSELLKQQQQADETRIALEKIASDERIRNMELSVDIKTAAIEADAQKAVAAFESISSAVQSTTANVSSLAGAYGDLGRGEFAKQWALEGLLDDANDRANATTDANVNLINKQIEMMDAQMRVMERGDGLFTIQLDGVEPELEAIMWKIIERVQMRINAEGVGQLLGVPQ